MRRTDDHVHAGTDVVKLDASNATVWTTEYVGTVPLDLAGGAGGRLAVVGELHGFGGSVVSYVTSYAP